jgi:hypothetical protein
MPRHNLLTIFGGETQEEADLKSEVTQRMLEERYPFFDYLPKEAIEQMTEENEFVNMEKWVKYFNVTVRVQRVRGSFIIGALIDKLNNMVGIEKGMRDNCTTTLPPTSSRTTWAAPRTWNMTSIPTRRTRMTSYESSSAGTAPRSAPCPRA